MPDFTVCVLLYGDYPDLAKRCLDPLIGPLAGGEILLRVGANVVSKATESYLKASGLDEFCFRSTANVKKYPMMRHMMHGFGLDPVTTRFFMWFDDDSCLRADAPPDFFARCAAEMENADVMGDAKWRISLRGNQADWIEDQPWYGGKSVRSDGGHHRVHFANGGWWCARSDVLKKFDYPFPTLLHRGGDVMLGELCRQQGLRLKDCCDGVAVNAGPSLKNSSAPRRGFDSEPVGFHYRRGT